MKNQREHHEQCVVIAWCELNKKRYPCLGRIYAIPNMGKHHVSFRIKQAREGLKKGMLDLCLPWPVVNEIEVTATNKRTKCYARSTHGLYIEMKVKPNKLSPEQKEWVKYLLDVGYEVKVAWSADEAIEIIKNYIDPEEKGWINYQ